MGKLLAKVNKNDYRIFTNKVKDIIFSDKFQELKNYIQHGDTSTFKHLLNVALASFIIVERLHLKVNIENLILGALLHDYVFYDWHNHGDKLHGFHHPDIAAENAIRDYKVDDNVKEMIESHMWPLTISKIPTSREAIILCAVDKLCSIGEIIKKRRKK